MRTVATALFIAILTTGATGCSKNPVSQNPSDLGLGAAGGRAPAGPAGGDCAGLPTAPIDQRVDLYSPTFANPTRVTNPLFPISNLSRTLLLGNVEGIPLRVETTLLAQTRIINVNGVAVETAVSQYIAWLDGRIEEVAIDWYAQDDQGAVWYLGEDVFNYEDGRVADTGGTWLAGRDGPLAMIMPAQPKVGNVWRPENICNFVFEEVAATAIEVTVEGPRGLVTGAILTRELHMDGTYENKTFAPAYGEFSTGSGTDLEAIALAVPTDALSGPLPAELRTLSSGAAQIFRAARFERWDEVEAALAAMNTAWTALRVHSLPPMLEVQMNTALGALAAAVGSRDDEATRQASINVARAGLDFQLQYLPRVEIDLAHIELWHRQMLVDAAAHDRAGVRSDIVSIKLIRDRFARPLDGDLQAMISAVESAALAADLAAATEGAERLQESLARSTRSVPAI